jgi:alanine racemase
VMTSFALRCWAEISLRQIADNYLAVRSVVGPGVEVMPVVKADAYGHGAVEVARVLTQQGASSLAVASVEEGATLRQSGVTCRIVTMSDFIPADRPALIDYSLTPVLHSLDALRDWNEMARRAGHPLRYHLKVDSGFGRLGTRAAAMEIAQAIRAATHARLEGLMTHFASAGDYTSPQTEEQIAQFRAMMECLRAAGIDAPYTHLSSSAPIAYGRREAWGNMVRPGLALYGYIPSAKGAAPANMLDVKPALSWKATVLLVKDVAKGAAIGYGALYRAETPMRIAVLSAGYADGIPHRLSNRGQVIAKGKLTPILGAVSMDVTTIDASHCPDLQPGDAVTLLGREGEASLDAEQIAQTAGIISYSVLCGISPRVRRVYI